MGVYTHEPMGCCPNERWPLAQVAHLIADREEELHDFARRIGMQRAWFQAHGRLPHYDLTPQRYQLALAAGAETMTVREFANRFLGRRSRRGSRGAASVVPEGE